MSSRTVQRTVQFEQVDVFTAVPFKGNPLAVIFAAEGLSTERMQQIARWTNLSETAFLLPPTNPRADYRVRIFTTAVELPFAGHPTLGAAHALLDPDYTPKTKGRLVQECGVGLITLAEQDDGAWTFAAPPCAVDNGAPWLIVRLKDARECLGFVPGPEARAAIAALTAELETHSIALSSMVRMPMAARPPSNCARCCSARRISRTR